MRIRTFELPTRAEDPIRFVIVFDRLAPADADEFIDILKDLSRSWGAVDALVYADEVELG
jgi:hypothetical protein